MTTSPRVLFICVKNGGKSRMAAGLMSDLAGDSIDAVSAGTKPGKSLNQLSVKSLDELGIGINQGSPKPVSDAELEAADIVITWGREATVEVPSGTELEDWDTDEPSERGIEGIERMRLVRENIRPRVEKLHSRLLL
ncbi:low molecular weight phosphatase family protein [Brevibacterium aurantiacum]|uniref:Low molecular weight phosphatase family protein n=1 Tax=Brevibacterium aurantiacum TaxID=273384 RepID=A0A556C3V6_BREAU|nr:low molecular weight phosphatase family protein [Brevibacterium aurantiacum]TSI12081.1 low molecular weight phosphatase family protein [Brevibacterium aurantiacum]